VTTRKRSTATRPAASSPRTRTTRGRRRTTSGSTYRRRRTPSVASTVGTAAGVLVVTMLLHASWPVRIGLVVLAVLLVGGYFVLEARREAAPAPTGPATTAPTTTPEDPA
jgi:hypothetical protein